MDKSQDKEREERQRRERREREKNDRDRNRDRERRTHRRSTSTPRASASTSGGGGGGLASAIFGAAKDRRDGDVGVATMPVYGSVREKPRDRDREREREKERERRKEKEKDRDREQRRKARELEEREMEYLRKWDDIPISALFGKGKEKEREKEREREREKAKEKEREKRERYKERERLKEREQRGREKGKSREDARSRSRTISVDRRRQTQSEYRERTRSPRPDKGKGRDNKDRDTTATTTPSTSTVTATPSQYQSHRTNRKRPDPKSKSYIPFTREEAELAGMKIICAKFKSAAAWEREQRDREARRAILRARMEGRILPGTGGDGKEGAMASTTSFGSTTSTLTLAGGGTAFGLSMGGGGEKERERRYTSTGPSLAAALASFVPPLPGAVAPTAAEPPSDGVQGHKSGAGVFEMDSLHSHPHAPLPPPASEHHHPLNITSLRKGSLPSLGGLGKLVGAGGSSTTTDSMVGSPLNTNITPGSSGSVTGGGKFSMGLFGVGKDRDKDKEEDETARATRKREERERKEREKRQKAIEKEHKKGRKRREGGDLDDEDEVGSSLSWRLGATGKRWGRGSIPTAKEDNEEWERLRSLEKMEPITFAPMPAKKAVVDDDNGPNDGDGRAFSKSMVSIPTTADSATLHDLDYMEPASPPLPSLPVHSTPMKPKLHVSTSGIGPDAEIHTDSDSCSVDISSPVFAHSSDSEDDERCRRAGYRYGGYHAKEKEKEKDQEKVKTKDVADVDKAEEKLDTPATVPVRRKELDRGEWVILDMGNDHGVFSLLYHSQNARY